MTFVPGCVADMSATWFSSVLGRFVSTCQLHSIGADEAFTGGALFRATLGFVDQAPTNVIVKLAPTDPALRLAMARANAREVAFYTKFSGAGALPIPRCLFGSVEQGSGASVLVLEDLGDLGQVAFSQGCGAGQAHAVVRALADVHLANWGAPGLEHCKGADVLQEFDFAALWAEYSGAVARVLPDFALPNGLIRLGDAMAATPAVAMASLFGDRPFTTLHRDIHLDNILFDPRSGAAKIIDWQMMAAGRGGLDVGYFALSSMTPVQRRNVESDLIQTYADRLGAGGVADYGMAEIKSDFRLAAAWKLFVTVMATCLLDNSTAHKRAWRRHDVDRLGAFIDDHDIVPADLGL